MRRLAIIAFIGIISLAPLAKTATVEAQSVGGCVLTPGGTGITLTYLGSNTYRVYGSINAAFSTTEFSVGATNGTDFCKFSLVSISGTYAVVTGGVLNVVGYDDNGNCGSPLTFYTQSTFSDPLAALRAIGHKTYAFYLRGDGNIDLTFTISGMFTCGTPTTACTSSWTVTHDFRQAENNYGWLPAEMGAGLQDTSGYHAAPADNLDGTISNKLVLNRTSLAATLQSVSAEVDYVAGSAATSDLRQIKLTQGTTTLFDDTHPPATGHRTLTWTGSLGVGTLLFTAYASGAFVQPSPVDGNATLISITLGGTGLDPDGICHPVGANPESEAWAFPVAQGDQSGTNPIRSLSTNVSGSTPQIPYLTLEQSIPAGSYDHDKAATFFLTVGTDKYVHAAIPGTVTSIFPLDSSGPVCSRLAPGFDQIAPAYTCSYAEGLSVFRVGYHNAAAVTVQGDTADLTYIVANVRVSVGETISKGCILGVSLSFYTYKPPLASASSVLGGFEQSPDGYTIVQGRASGLPFDIIPNLREQPLDLDCSQTGGGVGTNGQGCSLVKNASFSPANDGNWISNEVPQSAPGETQGLWLKVRTYQQLTLDPGATFTIDVVAHLVAAPDVSGFSVGAGYSFTLQLGSGDPIVVPVSGPVAATTQIAGTTYSPTAGNEFDLALTPTESTRDNIVVDFVCVNDGVASPTEGSECILVNPYFDGSTGWTPSGTVLFEPGIVTLDDGATIAQTLMLAPKDSGPQEYTLTVHFRKKGASVGGEYGAIDWAIASATGASPHSPDQSGYSELIDTFDISSKSDYTLTLQADSSHITVQVQITSVCLATSDGAPTPGYVSRPPITASCRVCSYSPVGNVNMDLGEAIGWLFCSIAQIWQCQAKQILVGIWQTLVSILTFIGFARMWLAYTTDGAIKWLLADWQVFARWLNGEFLNIMSRIIPTNTSSGTSFWDALVALINGLSAIINHLIDALLGLAKALLGIVLAIIQLIGNVVLLLVAGLLGFINRLMDLITSAINAPPSLPAGVPICDTSASMIPESCVPIFMLDNTIFAANSPFAFIIPLVEGSAGFALLLWAFNKFKSAIVGVSE